MAPATTSVPRVIASVTGLLSAAPRFTFSVRRVLCVFVVRDALFAVLRLRDAFARFGAVFVARDALFVVLRLRDAFARFEAVFVARDAVFAAVRPRALPPPTLARDLDAVVLAEVLLRVAAVLDAVFLEAAVFFFRGSDFFLAGRPRALIPPPDLEAVVFDDLAIQNSLSWIGDLPAPAARQQSHRKRGQGEFAWDARNNLEALCDEPFAEPSTGVLRTALPTNKVASMTSSVCGRR